MHSLFLTQKYLCYNNLISPDAYRLIFYFAFMLQKNDMAAIRATMQEVVKETVASLLEQNNHIFKLEIRDEMYAMNKALEQRLNKKIEDTRRETVLDIAEILEVSVLPQISTLQCEMIIAKQDIVALKQKVAVL